MSRRLYRSRNNSVIAGICGGIGEYFDIDPIIVRLIWVFAVFSGVGIFAYIIMWIVIPEGPIEFRADNQYEDGYYNEPNDLSGGKVERREKSKIILGGILILIGGFSLMEKYMPWFDFDFVWPVGLVLLGVYLIYKEKGDDKDE